MRREPPPTPVVRYRDPEPSGLALVVGELLEANLRADPDRARLLRPAAVEIVARDLGIAVRLDLDRGGVLVASGSGDGRADLVVVADAVRLIELVRAPLRLGVPDPFRPDGRRALAALLAGDIRLRGALRRPLALVRLARLLSVS